MEFHSVMCMLSEIVHEFRPIQDLCLSTKKAINQICYSDFLLIYNAANRWAAGAPARTPLGDMLTAPPLLPAAFTLQPAARSHHSLADTHCAYPRRDKCPSPGTEPEYGQPPQY